MIDKAIPKNTGTTTSGIALRSTAATRAAAILAMINIPRGSSGRVPDESGTVTVVCRSVEPLAGDTSTVLRTLRFSLSTMVSVIWTGS